MNEVAAAESKKFGMADRRLILSIVATPLNALAEMMGDHFVSMDSLYASEVIPEGEDRLIDVCEMLADCGVWFGPRRELEQDDGWRQLIPYVVLRRTVPTEAELEAPEDGHAKTKYLVYRRAGHIEEQRLANRLAIGWGGHIDLPDSVFVEATGELSLHKTVTLAAEREIMEELGMLCRTAEMDVLGLIISDDETGRVHVGLVLVLDCLCQVAAKEDLQLELEWLTPEEIIARDNHEGWTRIVAEELSKKA